jgi:DNA primase
MYNSANTITPITYDDIMSRVSEYDIYAAYIGEFKVNGVMKSPLRKDKNPSFCIYQSRQTGRLRFKDYATGEKGNVIDFVKLYINDSNYSNVLQHILKRTGVKTIVRPRKYVSTELRPNTQITDIGVVRQALTEEDRQYWLSYGIRIMTLKLFNVDSIKYYINNGKCIWSAKEHDPLYCYKIFDKFKIYRPKATKGNKWRNNLGENDVEGLEQLMKHIELNDNVEVSRGDTYSKSLDVIIITKSLKDVMVYHELGYHAIAVHSETSFLSPKVLSYLKKHSNKLLINFDRDKTGVTQQYKIYREYGIQGYFMPKKFNAKDVSDAVQLNGKLVVKKWLNKTIK